MKLDTKVLGEIKQLALFYYKDLAVNKHEQDMFLARCYAQATIDILTKYGYLK